MVVEFPSYEQMAKEVAEKALDEYLINGKTLREWIKIIAEQEPKTEWIPVNERLPEKHGNYLVTLIDKDYSDNDIYIIQISYWTGLKWELDFEKCNSIIAWQPLPTPYEPQERSE